MIFYLDMASHRPLRDRVLKSSSITQLSASGGFKFGPLRPAQYKWNHESMVGTMKAVIVKGMSVQEAAQLYDVPKSTLGNRVSGRVLPGATSGPPTYLPSGEEEE